MLILRGLFETVYGAAMKIALAQINQVLGDFSSNARRMGDAIERAEQSGADLVVFPEMAACGAYPSDLLLNDQFIRDNLALLDRICAEPKRIGVLVGYVRPSSRGNKLENAAALIDDGQIISTHVKTTLAVHGAYDEHRYFEPADSLKAAHFRGTVLGIAIGEDILQSEVLGTRRSPDDRIADVVALGAEVVVNLAASPFTLDNHRVRIQTLEGCASSHRRPVAFVNLVGGNDDWIFDGQSLVFDSGGRPIACAESFAEDLLIVDMAAAESDDLALHRDPAALSRCTGLSGDVELHGDDIEAIIHALMLGVKDVVRKRGGQSVLIALDGDIGSSVTAAVAAAAVGADKVHGARFGAPIFPSRAQVDISDLSSCIGIRVDTYREEDLQLLKKQLSSIFSRSKAGTQRTIDSAVRRMLLKSAAEAGGHMLLSCDDKTDLYLHGPSLPEADFAVLSDIPKSMLYRTAGRLGEMGISPLRKFARPMPSDLLASIFDEASTQTASIGEVDDILDRLVRERLGAETILSLGFNPALTERVVRMMNETASARRSSPPRLNITSKAYGFYTHLPLCRSLPYRQADIP